MRFKEFLQLELDGLYGNIKAATGDISIVQKHLKDCKPVKNHGSSVSRAMRSIVKPMMPARPAGLTSYKKPMTIPSLL